MTITASAETTVVASPREVLEFALDLDRYRQVDPKILRVWGVTGPDAEGHGSVNLIGRVQGMPPAPDRHRFTLVRWSDLTFTGAPRHPARLTYDFTGRFHCEPAGDGTTLVRHSYELRFKGPFRLMEPRVGRWLTRQVQAEVDDLAAVFAPGG